MLARCSCEPLRLAYDRSPASAKSIWLRARKVENQYAVQLRKIAHSIDALVRQFDPNEWESNGWVVASLEKYARTIEPWAEAVGARMVAEVAARDKRAWQKVAAQMGRAIHREIEQAPTGRIMRQRMADQVTLITSLPLEAAERVHTLTLQGITEGTRAKEIAARIFETGEVTKARATCIARTEVGRTSTELTKARAESVGSVEFIWRTAGDSDVRPMHKALNGKVFRWDSPPVCDIGKGGAEIRALPACIWNCRCYAETILAD